MKNAFIRNKRNYKRVKSSMSYQFNLSKRDPRFSYGHLDKSLQKYESLNQENNNIINKEKRIDFNFSKIHLDVINILDKCQNEDDDKSFENSNINSGDRNQKIRKSNTREFESKNI